MEASFYLLNIQKSIEICIKLAQYNIIEKLLLKLFEEIIILLMITAHLAE